MTAPKAPSPSVASPPPDIEKLVERLHNAAYHKALQTTGDALEAAALARTYIEGEAAATIRSLSSRLREVTARIAQLEARLEVDHAWKMQDGQLVRFEIPPEERANWPDGIECRDETIKLLEEQLGRKSTSR